MSKKEKDQSKLDQIPIVWRVPEGLITPFATHMFVQTIENEFKVSFFEIKPPPIFDDKAPMPKNVNADYVGGVIVTPERLQRFVDVMQKHLNKHKEKMKKIKEGIEKKS